MFDEKVIQMIIEGIGETLYMTLVPTFLGYVLGMPLGILLTVTDKDGIRPNAVVYKVLDFLSNIFRSIPFLILLIMLIPLTRLIVGRSYGSNAMIVPLTIAAAPYIARMVESSLKEVDHGVIEAAQSMGEHMDDRFQGAPDGGAHLPDRQCDDRDGHDPRLFRNGRHRGRGRSWRDRGPLRL